MIDRAKLRVQLAKHEANRPFVYDDATGKAIGPGTHVKGYPTIGIGRNLYSRGLSESERQFLLDNDIEDCLQAASQFLWFSGLDGVRQAAVVELIFNMGLARFKGFKKFIGFMSEHRWVHAAGELKNSLWYTQVGNRAPTIINQILTGKWQ
jgi:lysozyme